jgi:hypothetical protein
MDLRLLEMIGVHTSEGEMTMAREFFELFKTPWEPFVPGRLYTAIITTERSPQISDVPLTIVFCSDLKDAQQMRLGPAVQHLGGLVTIDGNFLPIYDFLLTFNAPGDSTDICARVGNQVAGIKEVRNGRMVVRLGYNLFRETGHLLSKGQPVEHALNPTLDLHIAVVRSWMIEAGITFVEIPPAPFGHRFVVCLTHDIDFIGIRTHRFDSTMWGFLLRATWGTLARFLRGHLSGHRLRQAWVSVAKLPFVYAGWAKDFWSPFAWYLDAECGLPASYYLIPFKGRPGQQVTSPGWRRRATNYDVTDVPEWITCFRKVGAEVGLHGIDAWHNVELAKEEMGRITSETGESRAPGVRMHWLLADATSPTVLDKAGFDYDSTCGYNETPGYRAGTGQVFQPPGTRQLLELPLHIQDGALFYPKRLGLTEEDAWKLCAKMIHNAHSNGGVLTILWHDRSHAPERFWGDFYRRLIVELKSYHPWFATGRQAVAWFRARRAITFHRAAQSSGEVFLFRHPKEDPQSFVLRVYNSPAHPSGCGPLDLRWQGHTQIDLATLVQRPPIAAAN